MKQLSILILTFCCVTSYSQHKDSVNSGTSIFVSDPVPSYPGGMEEMFRFISKNLYYEKDSRGIEGKVFVEFVVNEDGSLSEIKIRKGLTVQFDKIALELVKKMPNWIPAKRDNKPIQTKMVLRIIFAEK